MQLGIYTKPVTLLLGTECVKHEKTKCANHKKKIRCKFISAATLTTSLLKTLSEHFCSYSYNKFTENSYSRQSLIIGAEKMII